MSPGPPPYIVRHILLVIALLALAGTATAASGVILSPSRLEFVVVAPSTGSANSQTFKITSAGPSEVAFTLEPPPQQSWFSFVVSQYKTPAEITVTVSKLFFPPSMLAETFRITPAGGTAILFPITLQYLSIVPNSTALLANLPDLSPWTYVQNGALPAAKAVALSAAATIIGGNYTANTTSDGNWLTIGGSYSGQGSNFQLPMALTCNCDGMSVGTYRGLVHLLMSGSTGSGTIDAYHVYHLDVTLNVVAQPSGKPVPVPAAVSFDYQLFGTAPAAQTINVSTDTGLALEFTVEASTESGKWLSVTPARATSPGKLSVAVAPANLAAGSYKGSIKLTPSAGAVTTVPVTLNITAPPPLAVTPLALSFRVGQGGTSLAQALQVTGGGPDAKYSVLIKSGAEWLVVKPTNGTATSTPSPITITVDASKLSPGNYTGSLVVTGTGSAQGDTTVVVSLTVTSALPSIVSILHSASYQEGGVAPGEIIAIFGSNIGPSTLAGLTLDAQGKVATTLGGVQVLFDNVAAPLVYVSATQIAAVVPYEVAGNNASFVNVSRGGQLSNAYPVLIAQAAPGIFTANSSGKGGAAVLNQDGSSNSPSSPAARGETVVLYMTGEGQTSPAGVTGKVTTVAAAPPLTPIPVLPVTIRIGGREVQPAFAGEAPGFVSGVMQLNFVIPDSVASGDLPLAVAVGPYASPSGVTISVK